MPSVNIGIVGMSMIKKVKISIIILITEKKKLKGTKEKRKGKNMRVYYCDSRVQRKQSDQLICIRIHDLM